MSALMVQIVLYALYAATIAFLFAMLFIRNWRRWWLRLATAAVGACAIAYPLFTARNTLGFPDPRPEPGRYHMLGWEIDEPERAIYMFLERPGQVEPLHYQIPFDLKSAIALQNAAMEIGTFKEKSITIWNDPETGAVQYEITLEKRFYGDYRTDR